MHFHTQNYLSLVLGYQKGKMAEKPQKNKTAKKQQRIMLKRLVKQGKHYLPLARKSLKTRRMLSENRRPEIFSKNERFSAKTGGLESPKQGSKQFPESLWTR